MAILTPDEACSYLERANSALKLTIKDAVINNSANARNDNSATTSLVVFNSQSQPTIPPLSFHVPVLVPNFNPARPLHPPTPP